MQKMPERRQQLWTNLDTLRDGLRSAGFNIGNPQGAVTSIFTRGITALQAVRKLQDDHKIIVNPVMYPAVPYGTSIVRITAGALHTPEQMMQLVNALVAVSQELPLLEGNVAATQRNSA
jgi:glycine C-acetyltransferase